MIPVYHLWIFIWGIVRASHNVSCQDCDRWAGAGHWPLQHYTTQTNMTEYSEKSRLFCIYQVSEDQIHINGYFSTVRHKQTWADLPCVYKPLTSYHDEKISISLLDVINMITGNKNWAYICIYPCCLVIVILNQIHLILFPTLTLLVS